MALTTLFGTAQLALQNALAGALDTSGPTPRVPNFINLSLQREAFQREHPGAIVEERERFRREIMDAVRSYLSANGWGVAGTGSPVVNLLFRTIPSPLEIQIRTVEALYRLEVEDDEGKREVPVKNVTAVVGRANDAPPRGFVAVNDRTRVVSREHLILTYADHELNARLVGQNATTLNGTRMGEGEIKLHQGDVIACGRCRITITTL